MRDALARMYADGFMREYLMNAIAIANSNAIALLEVGKFTEAQAYSARAKALRQLLEKGKEHFVNQENIKKTLKEPLRNSKNIPKSIEL